MNKEKYLFTKSKTRNFNMYQKSLAKLKPGNPIKQVNKITRRDSSDVSEQYILPRTESLPINNLKKAQNLLPFKMYSKKQNSDRFKHRLDISIYKKYIIISNDMKMRLHVNNPVNDILAVSDIDKDFYRYVDGRPLHLHIPVFKSLKESVNKLLHIKQEIGYKNDCDFNIATNYRNEERIFDLAVKRLTYQVKCFDTFISEDYQKSMTFLTKCDKLRNQVDKQVLELQNVAIEKFTIMSKLIGLEYKYGLQQKYGRFLYYLSPPSWRLNNRDFARSVEIEAKGFDFGNSSEEDTFGVLFERMRKICYGVPITPALFFIHPKDLLDIFDTMETQQLHYYTHVNHLTPYTKLLKNGIKSLKEVIIQESILVESSIKRFESVLQYSEQRCAKLEAKFFKILYGFFYETVAASDVLKLTLHLHFCYERVLLEKPINMDVTGIAKGLENFYMDYSKRLDSIKSDAVRRAMTRCINMEKLKARRANNAAKELRLFYRLERELLRSHGIFTENIYKIISKSHKRNIVEAFDNINVKQEKNKALTEAEVEYLTLFTDWTENEDPKNFLQTLKINENTD